MIKYNTCIRCVSENVDQLMVNTCVSLNYPEERHLGVISQRIVNPTDALVCKECGHIEFYTKKGVLKQSFQHNIK